MFDELKKLRVELNHNLSKRAHALRVLAEEKERQKANEQRVADTVAAQEALQQLAQAIQQQSHRQIAKIVSRCLEAVFPDPYILKIEFVRKRGKTEAELYYLKDGHPVDPLRTSGGVLDISGLALRLSELMLSTPQPRKLLILDEPMKGISPANLPKAAMLIETLAKEMGVQIVVVTHNETLEIGKVVRL